MISALNTWLVVDLKELKILRAAKVTDPDSQIDYLSQLYKLTGQSLFTHTSELGTLLWVIHLVFVVLRKIHGISSRSVQDDFFNCFRAKLLVIGEDDQNEPEMISQFFFINESFSN